MGSEQSSRARGGAGGAGGAGRGRAVRPGARAPFTRGHTVATTAPSSPPDALRPLEATPSGMDSPGASVCSDSELPYISYTVNRPIGDSPKMSGKTAPSRRAAAPPQRRQLSLPPRRAPKKAHSIVVVKEARSAPDLNTDEEIRRLQEIPTFLPIMRGSLGLREGRDPDVLEGLDYRSWARLASRYQAHLAACAHTVSADQAAITSKVKEADAEISRLLTATSERQRLNARAAERLSRVHELSKQITRCHSLLNGALEEMDVLNNLLPVEQRLEPFVWTTG